MVRRAQLLTPWPHALRLGGVRAYSSHGLRGNVLTTFPRTVTHEGHIQPRLLIVPSPFCVHPATSKFPRVSFAFCPQSAQFTSIVRQLTSPRSERGHVCAPSGELVSSLPRIPLALRGEPSTDPPRLKCRWAGAVLAARWSSRSALANPAGDYAMETTGAE